MNEEKFPQKLKFWQLPKVSAFILSDIKLTCIERPGSDYKMQVYRKVKATWNDAPLKYKSLKDLNSKKDEIDKTFLDVISFRTLPNSMESIQFSFLIENLPLVEITHLLRHRTLSGIHAQCTGDRDLREDSFYLPNSFTLNQDFYNRYRQLVKDAVQLYSDMVDSAEVSLMDARYVLPRSSGYFYYFTINLKDLIMFVNQRKCTMIQPEVDNYIAHQMYIEAISTIPELSQVLSMQCDKNCHYIKADDDLNTRLYKPDENHQEILNSLNKPVPNSVYKKTRKDMGSIL